MASKALKIQLPALHPGQQEILASPARFKVVPCGRRFGKTLYGSCIAIKSGLEGRRVWWVAPDYPRAKIGWNMMMELTAPIPGRIVRRMDKVIEFPGGGWVQLKSGKDPESLRGESLDGVVLDEAADIQRTVWFDSLRPALSDRQGWGLILGSPKGRGNLLYELSLMATKDPDNWETIVMPTWKNPYIVAEEIEQARRDSPERTFRQEYGAEFVGFEGRVYDNFMLDGSMCVYEDVDTRRYHSYWGGIDFGFRNPCVILVGGEDSDGTIDIIDEHYERRMKPGEITAKVMEMQAKYGIKQWWADPADPKQIAELQDAGINVEPAPRTTGNETSVVVYEVGLVAKLLEQDPVGLRFFPERVPETVREHDVYRYPPVKDGNPSNEMPLKIDDHAPNAVHYMIHGLSEWYGWPGASGATGPPGDAQGLSY